MTGPHHWYTALKWFSNIIFKLNLLALIKAPCRERHPTATTRPCPKVVDIGPIVVATLFPNPTKVFLFSLFSLFIIPLFAPHSEPDSSPSPSSCRAVGKKAENLVLFLI